MLCKDLLKKFLYVSAYKRYIRTCKKSGQKKYILFGTPKHGNIGGHAITLAVYQFFKDMGKQIFEVSSFDRKYILPYMQKHINKEDILMINGGGFMGSLWIEEEKMIRDVFSHFLYHKIVILPQTIYYKEDCLGMKEMNTSFKLYNAHQDLVVCTREAISYRFACEHFKMAKVIFVPDMVLYYDNFWSDENRKNVLFCLRSDSEKSVQEATIQNIKKIFNQINQQIVYTDTVIHKGISKKERNSVFINKLLEFSKYEIIVTDRLHGMIFAALTETPCIVLSNYNYKVKGVYEWIKELEYVRFIEDESQLEKNILELLSQKFPHQKRVCDKTKFAELITLFEE